MSAQSTVRQLRLVVTTPDYEEALHFYRDVLGLPESFFALQVGDAHEMTDRLAAAGATVIARPVPTPRGSLNSRLGVPAGLQLTLFQGDEEG